jgi:hypothetical protein
MLHCSKCGEYFLRSLVYQNGPPANPSDPFVCRFCLGCMACSQKHFSLKYVDGVFKESGILASPRLQSDDSMF